MQATGYGVLAAVLLSVSSASAQSLDRPNENAPEQVWQMGWFAGTWDLVTHDKQPDGSIWTGRATSHAYFILDGYAMQDDFRALDRAGRVVFRGTSIRTWDPRSGKLLIRWLMVDDPGMTDITAEFSADDRRFSGTGRGSDLRGKFLERFTYTFADASHYTFEMSRSYDDGETWIENFNRIEATRR